MLGKLLSLLLHAKAGAISGVFLLGATGALVSVSALNGTTTITQPSASSSASANAQVRIEKPEASESPEPSKSPEPSESPEVSTPKVAVTTACSDEAKALALQVQRVDTAFSGFHTDLVKLRGTRAADVLAKSDAMLKEIRQAAVKAIHATATAACKSQDDENGSDTNDENDVADNSQSATSQNTDSENQDNNNDESKTSTTPVTFTGTDAASIADQAILQMQAALDTAKNAPVVTSTPKLTPTHDTQKKGNDQGGHHN